MSSDARWMRPRSTASADSTRRPIPLSPSTFSTRRAVSVTSSRPVCTTSRMVRSDVIAAPRRRRVRTACVELVTRQRMLGSGAQVQEVFDVAGRAGQRAGRRHRRCANPVRRPGARPRARRRRAAAGPTRRRPRRRAPCRPRTVVSPWERYRRRPTRTTASAGSTVDSEMKDRSATTQLDRTTDRLRRQLADVGALQ